MTLHELFVINTGDTGKSAYAGTGANAWPMKGLSRHGSRVLISAGKSSVTKGIEFPVGSPRCLSIINYS